MKRLIAAVAVVTVALFGFHAAAQRLADDTAVLTATAPTERADGSELDALAAITVYRDGVLLETVEFSEPGGVFSWADAGLPSGRHCYHVTATDTDGNESAFSNEACKRIYFPPRAPSLSVN